MKKLFTIILALSLAISLSSCFGSMGSINDKTPNGESTEAQNNDNTKTDTNTNSVTIEEQILFDDSNIKITATGISYKGFFGPEIKIIIENNSDQNITVQSRKTSINNLMISTIFSADVAAGKKKNDTITLSSSDLEVSGITIIKDIELSLHIIDADSWDTILDTDLIKLTTDADASFVQEYDDSGFVAYDSDGIKVVVKKLNSSDSFWGSDLYLYIENNTKNYVTVQARDVSINGFMVDPIFSCELVTGKKAFDTMTFMESDLTDNDITDISDMELKLHIFDADSWDTIKDTDIIKVSFN